MTDLNLDTTASGSLWTIVISIVLLILAIKFPILFLVNGLVGIGFGLYYLIVSYVELANTNISDSDIVIFNYVNYMGWITTILGVASMIIFFFLKYNKTI
jgi:hypothetical protein